MFVFGVVWNVFLIGAAYHVNEIAIDEIWSKIKRGCINSDTPSFLLISY